MDTDARAKLIAELETLCDGRDTEAAHSDADDLLLGYINDPAITAAYAAVPKWYA